MSQRGVRTRDQDVGLPFMLILCLEIPDVINIKPISGHAHIWTYCMHDVFTVQDEGLPFYVHY